MKTAAHILGEASTILQDVGRTRWNSGDLLAYLNDARKKVWEVRPEVFSTTATITLAAGTKQAKEYASGGRLHVISQVIRTASGVGITPVNKQIMDAFRPSWHADKKTTKIRHYMVDENNPSTLWVYPPAIDGTQIEVVEFVEPAELSDDNYSFNDGEVSFVNAYLDYVLYKAYAREAEYAPNLERAKTHYMMFAGAIGDNRSANLMRSPNATKVGGDPIEELKK